MVFRPLASTLRQLQYAAAVAETRSFRKAATACAVSQPALSAQLAALERALGVRLFERDRRSVRPTAAGEALLPRLRAVLLAAADLDGAAGGLRDPFAGTLRVGVLPTVAPYLLPAASPLLASALPRLTLLWTEERTDALVSALRDGRLDAALLAAVPGLDGLAKETIGRDDFLLAAPRGHALVTPRRPASLAELHGADVLLLDDGHCFRDQALALCARAKARENGFRATSLGTLAQMAGAGTGVTLLPALAAATEAPRARLALRRFAAPAPHRTLVLVSRKGTPAAPVISSAAGVLREAFLKAAARP